MKFFSFDWYIAAAAAAAAASTTSFVEIREALVHGRLFLSGGRSEASLLFSGICL